MVNTNQKAPHLSSQRQSELFSFLKLAQLDFNDLSLLDQGFTHSSFANENKDLGYKDNERLEFLGDAVLEYTISKYLYENLEANEGDYTRIRSFVVSEEALAKAALSLKINEFIRVGKGEAANGGSLKKAILADCMEAIFASVSLDQGMETAQAFILKLLVPQIKDVLLHHGPKDYKTMLQEYVQKRYKAVPVYKMLDHTGPDHQQVFTFTVEFHGYKFGPVQGRNKKESEQNAARLAVDALNLDK